MLKDRQTIMVELTLKPIDRHAQKHRPRTLYVFVGGRECVNYFLISVVANVSDEEMQEHYDNFFEDVFVECEDKVIKTRFWSVLSNLVCRLFVL
jgi:hypothetical protein